jgi:hypothetical protein
LVALLIIEFPGWPQTLLPPETMEQELPGCMIANAQRLTTHRKPMWVVEVSSDCGDRAAGRYRRQ